jgi:uncharacterized membrane protein YphA (DoxX/SURF4 family)
VTAGLSEQTVPDSSALDSAAVRTLLAGLALAAGVVVALLARGSVVVLAVLAVIVAASNGYSKAYSP